MSTRVLRFFPSFRAWPLWWSHDDGGVENPDPRSLGMPTDLADAVVAWSDEWDAHFDEEDFTRPLFVTEADETDFFARGRDLARGVAAALAGQWSVRYEDLQSGEKVDLG